MQVSSLSQNNINHKGFKTDYKALRRQYAKAQFMFSNCRNGENFDKIQKAQLALEKLCKSNPIKAFFLNLQNFIILKKRTKHKQFKNKTIESLERNLINFRQNMSVEFDGKKEPLPVFLNKYDNEKNTQKREKMLLALIKAEEPLQEKLSELVVKRNEFAISKGYKNYYEFCLKEIYDMDYEEIENIIEEYSFKEDVKFNLKKRLEILAEQNGVSVDELKPYHFQPLYNYYNADSYIKSPEKIVELTKSVYQSMGFDIKKLEEQDRIFYDLYPQKEKDFFKTFCRFMPEVKSVGICSSLEPNIVGLKSIIHEFGHLVYNFGVSNLIPYKKQFPKAVYTEATAIMFEKLIAKENLLKDLMPSEVLEKFKRDYQIESDTINTLVLVETLLEKEIYENPHANFREIKAKLNRKYNLNPNPSIWYMDHFTTCPVRRPVYLKAIILAEKMYDNLQKALGGEILNNPKTAEILNKKIFKYGKLMNDKRFNKKLDNLV